MEIKYPELQKLQAEIEFFTQQNPRSDIWYELGRNKVKLERLIGPHIEDHNKDRKVIIDRFALKDENGETKSREDLMPASNGQMIPTRVIDFGENETEAKKLLEALAEEYNNKTAQVDFYIINKTKANKLLKEANPCIGWIVEFLFPKDEELDKGE